MALEQYKERYIYKKQKNEKGIFIHITKSSEM